MYWLEGVRENHRIRNIAVQLSTVPYPKYSSWQLNRSETGPTYSKPRQAAGVNACPGTIRLPPRLELAVRSLAAVVNIEVDPSRVGAARLPESKSAPLDCFPTELQRAFATQMLVEALEAAEPHTARGASVVSWVGAAALDQTASTGMQRAADLARLARPHHHGLSLRRWRRQRRA